MSDTTFDPFAALDKAVISAKEQEATEAAREKAETARREAEAMIRRIRQFTANFAQAILKTATEYNWKAARIEQATQYARGLVSHEDSELISLDTDTLDIVRSKFVYGLVLDTKRPGKQIAREFFNGQRQDWFPELFDQKLEQDARSKTPKAKEQVTTKAVVTGDDGNVTTTEVPSTTVTIGNVVDIKTAETLRQMAGSAVTPKQKRNRGSDGTFTPKQASHG